MRVDPARSSTRAVTDPAARRWLLEAIALANSVGAEIIAEGIESESMLGLMKQLGVRLFQGYYWGMPNHLLSGRRLPSSGNPSALPRSTPLLRMAG